MSLEALLCGGKQVARKLKRAQILLAADVGATDEEIVARVGVGGSTVYRTKRRCVEANRERALNEEARPGAERKVTGKQDRGAGRCGAFLRSRSNTSPHGGVLDLYAE